ncbi:Uncharacterised protein [uncultured archaeon]|nr:Uncharacterised protein [uncultured archaeon]
MILGLQLLPISLFVSSFISLKIFVEKIGHEYLMKGGLGPDIYSHSSNKRGFSSLFYGHCGLMVLLFLISILVSFIFYVTLKNISNVASIIVITMPIIFSTGFFLLANLLIKTENKNYSVEYMTTNQVGSLSGAYRLFFYKINWKTKSIGWLIYLLPKAIMIASIILYVITALT